METDNGDATEVDAEADGTQDSNMDIDSTIV